MLKSLVPIMCSQDVLVGFSVRTREENLLQAKRLKGGSIKYDAYKT